AIDRHSLGGPRQRNGVIDQQPRGFLMLLDILRAHAAFLDVVILQDSLLEGTNDIQGKAVLDEVLAEHDIAAEQGSGEVVLRPTDSAKQLIAQTRGGGHGSLERSQVHSYVNNVLFHGFS